MVKDAYQRACAFSSSGQLLYTGGSDCLGVKAWEVPMMRPPPSHSPQSSCRASLPSFIEDGEVEDIATAPLQLIAVVQCRAVRVWENGSLLKAELRPSARGNTFRLAVFLPQSSNQNQPYFQPSSIFLATVENSVEKEGLLTVWSISEQQEPKIVGKIPLGRLVRHKPLTAMSCVQDCSDSTWLVALGTAEGYATVLSLTLFKNSSLRHSVVMPIKRLHGFALTSLSLSSRRSAQLGSARKFSGLMVSVSAEGSLSVHLYESSKSGLFSFASFNAKNIRWLIMRFLIKFALFSGIIYLAILCKNHPSESLSFLKAAWNQLVYISYFLAASLWSLISKMLSRGEDTIGVAIDDFELFTVKEERIADDQPVVFFEEMKDPSTLSSIVLDSQDLTDGGSAKSNFSESVPTEQTISRDEQMDVKQTPPNLISNNVSTHEEEIFFDAKVSCEARKDQKVDNAPLPEPHTAVYIPQTKAGDTVDSSKNETVKDMLESELIPSDANTDGSNAKPDSASSRHDKIQPESNGKKADVVIEDEPDKQSVQKAKEHSDEALLQSDPNLPESLIEEKREPSKITPASSNLSEQHQEIRQPPNPEQPLQEIVPSVHEASIIVETRTEDADNVDNFNHPEDAEDAYFHPDGDYFFQDYDQDKDVTFDGDDYYTEEPELDAPPHYPQQEAHAMHNKPPVRRDEFL